MTVLILKGIKFQTRLVQYIFVYTYVCFVKLWNIEGETYCQFVCQYINVCSSPVDSIRFDLESET